MRDAENLVFVEVRYRHGSCFARADATIDARKQQKLIRTGAMFLTTSNYADHPVRFDVVAIDGRPGGTDSIVWIRDAFRPRDACF